MIHRNGEESYAKLPNVLGALQSCVSGTVVVVLEEGGRVPGKKKKLKHVFWSSGLQEVYLRKHVTPQSNISLISNRQPSIRSAYNNPSNLWVQDTSYLFCLCHIAQNFLRGNSNGKHSKKPLIQAGENL